jgi:hypothetical protein
MDVMKYTLEDFIKMCENAEAIARVASNKTERTKVQGVLTRIANTCEELRDCHSGEGVSVLFASSLGEDEKIHLTTYCNTNYALSVAVGLIEYILSREDISVNTLMEEIKTRIFEED